MSMSLKLKRLIICLLMMVSILSCEKTFKEDNQNKLILESPDDLKFALAGLYYRFTSIAKGSISSFLANGDDVVTNINSRSGGMIDRCTQSGFSSSLADDQLLSVYKPLYQTIACANNILKKSKELNQHEPAIQHLLGEVYFIRAYSYFWLVRLFGQVPIIENVDVDYTVKKNSFIEIYTFIEGDLNKAISYLPNSYYETRIKYITPHRGSAKALLAEVYLSWAGYPLKVAGMYSNAAKMAADVIDSADYFGYSLLPDLADLWNGKHDINQESVFSLYSSGAMPDWIDYIDNIDKYEDIMASGLYFSPYNGGVVAIQFYNSFPNNYRKDITYRTRGVYLYTPPCITDSLNPQNTYCPPAETVAYYIKSINLCTEMSFRKNSMDFDMSDSSLLNSNYTQNHGTDKASVIYLFRYSHTLLTYAEAKARSGNLDASAYEAVNQIRRRANKVDLHTPSMYDMNQNLLPEQFADSVVWERAWEFCDEPEGRWFNLLRLEMISKLKNLKYPNQGATFPVAINMSTYFFPIPQTDKMLNPNLQ
jgi:starch-binding outer membrane protein, SusD/RagB family